MRDLISRQAAIDAIESHIRTAEEPYYLHDTDKIMNHAFEVAASCVYNLPSAERKGKCDIEKALKLLSQQLIWMYDDEKISYEVCLDLSSKLIDIANMVRGEEDEDR